MESLLQSVPVDDPAFLKNKTKQTNKLIQTLKDLLSATQYRFLFNYQKNWPKMASRELS